MYLDDWLVLGSSEAVAKKKIQDLLSLLSLPQDSDKRGEVRSRTLADCKLPRYDIDTRAARIFPALARVEKFLLLAERFLAMSAPPSQLWRVLFGHLA